MDHTDCPTCGVPVEITPLVRDRRVGFCTACGGQFDVARAETGSGVGREMVVYEPMAVAPPPPGSAIVEQVMPYGVEITIDQTRQVSPVQGFATGLGILVGILTGAVVAVLGAGDAATVGSAFGVIGLTFAGLIAHVSTRREQVLLSRPAVAAQAPAAEVVAPYERAIVRSGGDWWLVDLERGGRVVLTLGRRVRLDRRAADWLARRLAQYTKAAE